jgi:hypothetical protein
LSWYLLFFRFNDWPSAFLQGQIRSFRRRQRRTFSYPMLMAADILLWCWNSSCRERSQLHI